MVLGVGEYVLFIPWPATSNKVSDLKLAGWRTFARGAEVVTRA